MVINVHAINFVSDLIYIHELLRLKEKIIKHDLKLDFFQSNSEKDIIDKIHEAQQKGDAILINAAAFTHTSIAIMDALSIFQGPIIEIHITNIHAREEFRHKSFISNIAYGIIAGFGFKSYELAIDAIAEKLEKNKG